MTGPSFGPKGGASLKASAERLYVAEKRLDTSLDLIERQRAKDSKKVKPNARVWREDRRTRWRRRHTKKRPNPLGPSGRPRQKGQFFFNRKFRGAFYRDAHATARFKAATRAQQRSLSARQAYAAVTGLKAGRERKLNPARFIRRDMATGKKPKMRLVGQNVFVFRRSLAALGKTGGRARRGWIDKPIEGSRY